ncbi:MAG: hypothetical protein ACLFUS_09995, partial [Candidatus Sumerlaeia bacterium]
KPFNISDKWIVAKPTLEPSSLASFTKTQAWEFSFVVRPVRAVVRSRDFQDDEWISFNPTPLTGLTTNMQAF